MGPSLKLASSSTTFSDDELNAMRYIAGYVPYSLLKKDERSHQVQTSTIECLGNMAVAGDDDIHDYTTKWVEIVNRGGLFPINNKSYQLFIAIESVVVQSLSTSYVSTAVKAEHCIKSHTLNRCLKMSRF